MKNFKQQLLDQLDDFDVMQEFNRRKLKVTDQEEEINAAIPMLFFFLTIILIIICILSY